MKKYFVVSDIHGFYDEMMVALNSTGFDINDPTHILISCGDLLDRGRQPKECIDFVLSIPESRRILVMGNHEENLIKILRSFYYNIADKMNGTAQTICDLVDESYLDSCALFKANKDERLNRYLNALIDYYETDKYIFVHSFLPINLYADWHNATPEEWSQARWGNPFETWHFMMTEHKDEFIKMINNKTIVFGHWHTYWAHNKYHNIPIQQFIQDLDTSPFYDEHIIGLDACTALCHKVNCVVLEEK